MRRASLWAAVLGVFGVGALALAAPPAGAANGGEIFVVQGLPGRTVDVALDGDAVATGLAGATLSRRIPVDAGRHTLTFTSGGSRLLARTVDVKAGSSTDVALHLPVDPTGAPVVTVFDNARASVPASKASVTVAHLAAVPPADVRVGGKVLFANIANGEALNLVVPVGTYRVDIVPAGATSPVVLGPLDLTVKGGSLNRVFAVGDPSSSTMRVVVQVLGMASTGSGAPDLVDTGTGGQAALHGTGASSALLRVPLRR
ncbi:DUF4397 domain-containing protein [Terrabacter sp. GCM10028922]|uniref:DUF4397 domain-containing protein n=1 Tax=Terrabacter sp. GCM10028922 TaxID=3273428 RepID=UPI003623B254